ncbi:MAG: hypothetical protein KAH84_07650, partial [Thiomargarita sp.]|nr:hypothetical protein [Thiomargarita sp.]
MGLFDNVNKTATVNINQTNNAPTTGFGSQDEHIERTLSSVEANKLIRNTYMLLSATLLFTAAMAGVA